MDSRLRVPSAHALLQEGPLLEHQPEPVYLVLDFVYSDFLPFSAPSHRKHIERILKDHRNLCSLSNFPVTIISNKGLHKEAIPDESQAEAFGSYGHCGHGFNYGHGNAKL